jgi:cytochrome c peroxidase
MHWHMVNPNLRDDEIDDLVAFLGALTDNSALPAIPITLPSGHVVPRCLNECLQ